MFILDVIPLAKIPLPLEQVFSYFSPEIVKPGGLVLVPLRKKKFLALVINVNPVMEKKMEIKRANFSLKKIEKVIFPEEILENFQISLAQWLSKNYFLPLGSSLRLFLPKRLIKKKKFFDLSHLSFKEKEVKKFFKKEKTPPLLFWAKERGNFYLKEIKETLKEGKEVLFLVPELKALEENLQKLKKISESVLIFHSNLKPLEEFFSWEKVKTGKAKIILGTRSALFLPFQNLGLIILDQEEDPAYGSWGKIPRYNTKDAVLKLAELWKAKVIFGSDLVSVESYYWAKKGKYKLVKELKTQVPNLEIVNMREEIKNGNFSIFSERMKEILNDLISKEDQAILFINRRGLSTALLCQECGFAIKCKNCDVPMVYHLEDKKPVLICHHCGLREIVPAICPQCQGWRFWQIGKGTQKVFEELKKLFPKTKILRLDSDIAPNLQKQKSIIGDFLEKKANILVATQLILKFQIPPSKLPGLVGVVIVDPILNLPEFQIKERVFHVLKKLRAFGKKILIQTSNPELSIFNYLKEDKIKEFYQEELKQRGLLFYPPFSEIIRLTFSHKNNLKAESKAIELKKILLKNFPNSQILGPAPAFIPRVKKKYIWQILVKLKGEKLKVKRLLSKIISPDWKVEVNPETLL